jgi:hypothetical protein
VALAGAYAVFSSRLPCTHEPLVGGQFVGELAQAADVVLPGEAFGNIARRVRDGGQDGTVGAGVLVIVVAQRGLCHGRDRAAAAQRPTAISDARKETLLKRIGDVRLALERSRARARAQVKFESGLAEAVLEVLEAEAVAVHAQEDLAIGGRHVRDYLGRIVAAGRALSRHRRQGQRGQRFGGVPSPLLLRPQIRRRDNA